MACCYVDWKQQREGPSTWSRIHHFSIISSFCWKQIHKKSMQRDPSFCSCFQKDQQKVHQVEFLVPWVHTLFFPKRSPYSSPFVFYSASWQNLNHHQISYPTKLLLLTHVTTITSPFLLLVTQDNATVYLPFFYNYKSHNHHFISGLRNPKRKNASTPEIGFRSWWMINPTLSIFEIIQSLGQ